MSRHNTYGRTKKDNKTGTDRARREQLKRDGKSQSSRKAHDTKGNNRRGSPKK